MRIDSKTGLVNTARQLPSPNYDARPGKDAHRPVSDSCYQLTRR